MGVGWGEGLWAGEFSAAVGLSDILPNLSYYSILTPLFLLFIFVVMQSDYPLRVLSYAVISFSFRGGWGGG